MKKAIPFTYYFLFFAGMSFLLPFIILYYQSIGFSGPQIGLLAGLAPLITLVASPFWTNLADNTRTHKTILLISLGITAIFLFFFPYFKTFLVVLPIVLLYTFFSAPAGSLADSATLSMLGDEKYLYGRVRLGGTIGWGVSAVAAGYLIEQYGLKAAFWGCAALLLLALLVSRGFQFSQYDAHQKRGSIRELLSDPKWIIFLALAFTGGISFASTANYLSPYMIELGAGESLIGISFLVSSLSELPVFFFGNRLLKRFNPYGLLVFALVISGIRSLMFAAAWTPFLAILVQVFQGLTFPAVWIAGVAYADQHAPDHLKATAQGLFGATTFGIGSAVGGLLGGFLLESIGGRGLFLVYGLLALGCIALISLARNRILSR